MGAGYHGGFGNTKGAKNNELKFNSKELSFDYSIMKIQTYLLDINHDIGKAKAKFFIETLGYSKDKPRQFFDALSEAINRKTPVKVSTTPFGTKFEFQEKIKGVNGKIIEANIVAVVQKDNGKTCFRIITVHPNKK